MNIDIATLFPEMLENYLSESVVGRARAKNIFTVTCHNIRDYTQDKHRRVDDTPYSDRVCSCSASLFTTATSR